MKVASSQHLNNYKVVLSRGRTWSDCALERVGELVLGNALQVSQGTARGCNCTRGHGGLGGTDCIAFAFNC